MVGILKWNVTIRPGLEFNCEDIGLRQKPVNTVSKFQINEP